MFQRSTTAENAVDVVEDGCCRKMMKRKKMPMSIERFLGEKVQRPLRLHYHLRDDTGTVVFVYIYMICIKMVRALQERKQKERKKRKRKKNCDTYVDLLSLRPVERLRL